ncbi:hypothetical protein T440DRAFT_408747 [Plenodomus tracheiphilus IPT5]|uniref:Acyltransferase 3 domain-containing protein n=1 Tax=Plenodomus tracheiphilus IPT5 TaxID=1408161 RepID=A0A6A7APM6_9PLEO|nr:hypothetical protein T440DRAFT_408747 [Plenodomus tracheiphilus IPT5]
MKTFAHFRLPAHDAKNDFLIGLRGFFVIQSCFFVFLLVFAPNAVAFSPNARSSTTTPHKALKLFSILLWNKGNISTGFLILSARTICIPFMTSGPGRRLSIAGSIFRRGIRVGVPVAVSLALSTAILHVLGYQNIDDFAKRTGNVSIVIPYRIDTLLVYFNSVFNLFWTTDNFLDQAGSYGFPGQMMWVISVIYQQSYTVYMTIIIIPYTRKTWRVKGAVLFILTAWWVQSWAWFTISGLVLADMALNMNLKVKAQRGVRQIYHAVTIPSYFVYFALLAIGILMQYLSVWSSKHNNNVSIANEAPYSASNFIERNNHERPIAQIDNYLVLLSLFLFVETSDLLQWILSNPVFVYFGKRSLSFFLVQPIVTYTLGIRVHEALRTANNVILIAACFISTLFVSLVGSETFYRAVEVPSHTMAHAAFEWMQS